MAGCAYYAVVFNKTKVFLLIIILRWKVPPQKTINGNRNFKRSFSFPFVDKRSLFLTKLFFEELNLVFCKVERLACFWDNQGTQGGLLSIFKWRGWSNWGKNPWDFQQNPLKNPLTNLRALKITDSIKWYNEKNFSKRSLDVRYCRTTYAPKNPFSNQGIQKMHGNFFRPKNPKIAKSKISNPKKVLRSSPSLEIRSTLWAKAAKYLKKFEVYSVQNGQGKYVFRRIRLYHKVFLDVLYILTSAWTGKLQNVPRFEFLCWTLPCSQPIVLAWVDLARSSAWIVI